MENEKVVQENGIDKELSENHDDTRKTNCSTAVGYLKQCPQDDTL